MKAYNPTAKVIYIGATAVIPTETVEIKTIKDRLTKEYLESLGLVFGSEKKAAKAED